MRKLSYLALAATMVVAVSGGAGAASARTESGEYHKPTYKLSQPVGISGSISNGYTFEVRPGERFVTIVLEDQAAEHVAATVTQDIRGDHRFETEVAEICDASTAPIKITPGAPLRVSVQEGLCDQQTPSTPTVGTITVSFTR